MSGKRLSIILPLVQHIEYIPAHQRTPWWTVRRKTGGHGERVLSGSLLKSVRPRTRERQCLTNRRRPICNGPGKEFPRGHCSSPATTAMSSTARLAHRPARPPRLRLCSLCTLGVLLCFLLSLPLPTEQASTLGERDFASLSSDAMASLISQPDPVRNIDPSNPSSHLSKILIPRAPDTTNNTLVRNYIADTLRKLNWDVEEDTFEDNTPYGVKRFTNIIATKDPKASRRVVLAAHFDSKYFPTYPQNQVRTI